MRRCLSKIYIGLLLISALFARGNGFAKADDFAIPPDAVLYADVEFRAILKHLYDALLPIEVADVEVREKIGIGLTEIQRIRFIVTPPGPSGAPTIGGVVDLAGEINVKEKLAAGTLGVEEVPGPDNKPMMMLRINGSPPWFMRQTGPKQVIMGMTPPSVIQLSSGTASGGTGRINELVAENKTASLLNVIAAIEPVRPMLIQAVNANASKVQETLPPQFHDVLQIPEWLDSISIRSALANNELETKVSIQMIDDASAIKMHNLMTRGVEFGFQMVQQSMKQRPEGSAAAQTALSRYFARLEKGLNEMVPPVDGKEIAMTMKGTQSIGSTGILVGLLLPAIQASREAARRMSGANNLKQIGLALHNYHDAFKKFPPRYSVDAQGKPLLSWRVHLLPFLDQQALYEKFHLDEPWNSPHNSKLITEMPSVYLMPGGTGNGKTNYLAFDADGGGWEDAQQLRLRDFLDGTSNTILVAEANRSAEVFWTNPTDLAFDGNAPKNGLSSARPGGFNVLFCDGSVRFLNDNINEAILKGLVTRNGGEVINAP